MIRRIRLAAALLIGLHSPDVLAQQAGNDSIPRFDVPGVTVTATRTPVDRELVPQRIDVVTSAEIERSTASDVGEALRTTTPVDVIAYPGLLAGVSVRGFRPQYYGITPRTLILLDGRPAGTNNVALLDVTAVERIEVLRGPASALYGSSAMGGVINVITRKTTEGYAGEVTGSYGAFDRYEARLRSGGSLGWGFDFDVALAAVGQNDGYRVGSNRTFASEALTKTLPDGTTTALPWVSPDSTVAFTEFQSRSGMTRLGYQLGAGWRLDAKGEMFEGNGVQNPGDLTPQDWDTRSLKDVGRQSAELQLSGDLGGFAPMLRVFSASEEVSYYSAPAAPNFVSFRTPTQAWGTQAQGSLGLGAAQLTMGADYTSTAAETQAFTADGVRGAPYSPDSSIRSAAGFAQGRIALFGSRVVASAGARLDRISFEILDTPDLADYRVNEESHTVLSPNAGGKFSLADGVDLYANVGRAFVTPEAFYVAGYSERRAGVGRNAVFVTRGNPELRPERSITWDGGVSLLQPASALDAELGFFQTRVEGRISSTFAAPSGLNLTVGGDTVLSTTSYINADDAEISGLEGSFGFDLGRFAGWQRSLRLFGNATKILEATERFSGRDTEQAIRNVADLTLVTGLDYDDYQRFSGRLAGRYVGNRVDTDYVAWWAPGEIQYPAYLVLDLSGAARIGDRYRLGLEVRNLTDEDYFEVRGYNLPGRALAITGGVTF